MVSGQLFPKLVSLNFVFPLSSVRTSSSSSAADLAGAVIKVWHITWSHVMCNRAIVHPSDNYLFRNIEHKICLDSLDLYRTCTVSIRHFISPNWTLSHYVEQFETYELNWWVVSWALRRIASNAWGWSCTSSVQNIFDNGNEETRVKWIWRSI